MRQVHNLRSLLKALVEQTTGETVTVGELLKVAGRRAHGPVLLLLGVIAVSPLTVIPGATWIVATLTVLFTLQVVIGLRHPWLPARLLQTSFDRKLLVNGVTASEKYAAMLDALVKPRLTFLTEAPFLQVVALACLGAALITYPLGLVPFAPLLPGLTILLFGLAITARDGAVLVLAAMTLAGAIFVLSRLLPELAGIWSNLTGS